jgi:hypothetical protein
MNLIFKLLNEICNPIDNKDNTYFLFYQDYFKLNLSTKDNYMQPYTNLKEIGQAYINENITRNLQSVDAVAATSPSPPRPALA